MMGNHLISHDKTVFDLYNMINPNCYQAFIIQYIIENKKEEALKCCDELSIAFEYYKWDNKGKQTSYVDSLICESNLEKWQKLAIIHIIANDVKSCRDTINNEIEEEKKANERRIEVAKHYKNNPDRQQINDLYHLFGFDSFL